MKKQTTIIILICLLVVALFIITALRSSKDGEKQYNTLPTAEEKTQNITIPETSPQISQEITAIWTSDFKGNNIFGYNKAGEKVWEQNMASSPLPAQSFNTAVEYVTIAPNGNLIVADGDGMMVQEIDRNTHELIWQYGKKDIQGYDKGYLHQPDKAYKINDEEVLINDGNNRRVIIINQNTNEIVWQYGETLRMGAKQGLLKGNTSVVPLKNGKEILITDTLEKKILIIDRATKQIIWEWKKPDAKWLQHVWPTQENTFVMEDRQKGEVFEINRAGDIIWMLDTLADGSRIRYPTDVVKLNSGNILIAEAGRGRVIEVNLQTKEIKKEYINAGFVTTIYPDTRPL